MERTPIRIEHIHIHNFRGIDDLTLEFPEARPEEGGVVVLAGDNGCGKTSVLDAITIGIERDRLEPSHRRFGTTRSEIVVTLARSDAHTGGRLTRSPRASTDASFAIGVPWHGAEGEVSAGASLDEMYERPRIVYLPAGHRDEERVVENLSRRLVNLFHRSRGSAPAERSPFVRLERFLQRFLGDDFRLVVLPASDRADSNFIVLTAHADVPIDVTSFEMARREATTRREIPSLVPLEELSAGMIELVVLAGKVLFHDGAPDVVLIDEPEQHFHVRWQRHILPALCELSPSTQFVAATHSLDVLESVLHTERILLVSDKDPRAHEGGTEFGATGTGE
jgi:energy-coupling factor transporter ATP-binding protein EcfA2